MNNRIDLVTLIMAIVVAAYAAMLLDYVADVDFGFSVEQIRKVAMAAALFMALLMAIDFFGKKLGKLNRPR
ncbi:hypothetical protein [Bradyrhizobium sp. NP1]|jgi:hypothetical protein|uniref:hypothetical protein n=1 Tax=Bradyrhizobium sp. NP1 TaxID=3049772 RepID=UPI0025A585F5|nr:hypothetical protein [Bradyrhizobium sp. NP1]WJR74903.1 hypothetical protein QOU61_18925 [Bradyrhizobium sp. NP1]